AHAGALVPQEAQSAEVDGTLTFEQACGSFSEPVRIFGTLSYQESRLNYVSGASAESHGCSTGQGKLPGELGLPCSHCVAFLAGGVGYGSLDRRSNPSRLVGPARGGLLGLRRRDRVGQR